VPVQRFLRSGCSPRRARVTWRGSCGHVTHPGGFPFSALGVRADRLPKVASYARLDFDTVRHYTVVAILSSPCGTAVRPGQFWSASLSLRRRGFNGPR